MEDKFVTNFSPREYNNPHEKLVEILKEKQLKISVAESFTGGNVSALITSVSGSSSVFYEGIVAYNENAKINRLSVERDAISLFKPVSYQVAMQMADGLRKDSNCDIAISTTGIAGPNSDDSNFPVGLIFIGVSYKDHKKVYKYELKGSRQEITQKGSLLAILLAIQTINNI